MLGNRLNFINNHMTTTCKLILLSLLCFNFVEASQACTCMPSSPPIESIAETDAVFTGKAVSRKRIKHGYTFEFKVKEVWKGISQSYVLVSTGRGGGDCGYRFKIGKSYIVYAYHSKMYADHYKNGLETIICTRTNLLAQADFDIQELGPPIASGADLPGKPQLKSNYWLLWSILLVILLLCI